MLHDLRGILEGEPTGQPITLVAAMINVAITGLYADAIADGMKLQAWQEPQLAAIQSQLQQTDLLPILAQAFQGERAFVATFERLGGVAHKSEADARRRSFNPLEPVEGSPVRLPDLRAARVGVPEHRNG